MKPPTRRVCLAFLCATLGTAAWATEPLPLFDFAALDLATAAVPNGARAERADVDSQPGLRIAATPEDGKWPGVVLKAPAGKWDLSVYDAVEVDLRNPGAETVRFGVRVDNPEADGNKGCNTENGTLRPGRSRTLRVTFGKSWGGPGFELDRANVVALLVFFDQPKTPVELLVTAARAMPPPAPAKAQGVPGPPIDFGPAFHAPTQLGENDATGRLVDIGGGRRALRVEADASSGQWPGMALHPPGGGKWNLDGCKAVDFDIENPGDKPLGIGLRVDNPGADGRRNCNAENARLAPGERKTFRVTFGRSYEALAFILETANVTACLVFFNQPKEPVALLVHGVTAVEGQPPKPFVPQAPRETVTVGFEPGEAETDFVLRGGSFTTDAPVAGTRSLTGDTRGKEAQWFKFAATAAGLLAPGHSYRYAFRYRVLHAEPGARAYSLFRSRGKG
jgi:cyclic lactone autoinducer peptide